MGTVLGTSCTLSRQPGRKRSEAKGQAETQPLQHPQAKLQPWEEWRPQALWCPHVTRLHPASETIPSLATGSSSTSPSLSPCPRDVAAEGLVERRNKPGGMQGDRHSMAGRALEGAVSVGEGEIRAEEPLLAPWGCQDLAPAASSTSPYQHLSAIFNYTAQNAASANPGAAGRPPGAGSEQLLLSHRGHLHVPAAWSRVPSPARTPCSTHQGLSAPPCLLPGLGRRSRAGGGRTRGSTVPPAPALCPHCSTGQVSLQQQGP